jgi:SAM-dependent methyltransferase
MPTPEELLQIQKAQWSAAAPAWEKWDDWFERNLGAVSEWLCDAIDARPGKHVLDVACGSGHPAALIAQRVAPSGRVTATDLSPDMVQAARRRARQMSIRNIEIREMNAQDLDFADGSFDAATCRFGLMFCPDPARAAGEVRRLLRPGGRFALTVWDEASKNPFFTLLNAVVGRFIPAPPPDPNAPGPFRLAPPGELEGVLKTAGFSAVTVQSRPMTFVYESPAQYWEAQSELAAPIRAAIATLESEVVARLKSSVLEAVAPYTDKAGTVTFSVVPLCASATR